MIVALMVDPRGKRKQHNRDHRGGTTWYVAYITVRLTKAQKQDVWWAFALILALCNHRREVTTTTKQ